MGCRRFILLFFLGMLTLSPQLFAQKIPTNPASVDVNKMSDDQIRKMLDEMKKRGMGLEEAISLARARGASQLQIDQLRRRVEALNFADRGDSTMINKLNKEEPVIEELSEKAVFEISEEESDIFGFHFFNSSKLSFNPSVNVPVSDEYALGSGDEVVINVYGASQQTYILPVAKNGAIQVPDLGPVYVGGLSYIKAKERIKNRLVNIYAGLQGSKPNTFVEISLGALKGITVNVIGEVHVPGTYTLPATASAFNALYLAGGPSEQGSFRRIDVMRDGKVFKSIDVYSYLVDGKSSDNIQLRDQDVILVRPYQNRIKVAGQFKRIGVFESMDGEFVGDMIRYAGGFTEKAYTHRIELYRNNTRTLSFKDVPQDDFGKVKLMNGDSLVIREVVDRYENRVSIEGAIYRPGNYEFTQGLKLSQLMQKAEGVKEEAYMQRGLITRKNADMTLASVPFSVKNVLNGVFDVELQKEDRVSISSIFDMREARTIEVFGNVQFPGTYAYAQHITLKDVIFQAGGFKEGADVSGIEVARRLSHDETAKINSQLLHTYQFAVDRELNIASEDANFELLPFDQVYIRQAPGFRPQGTVQLQGEIKYAGDFGISKKQERISEIIKRAGGFTPEAYVRGASLRRKVELSDAEYETRLELAKQDSTIDIENIKKVDYVVVGIQLDEILKAPGSEKDIYVADGDQILVPSRLQTVKVSGAVLNPVGLTYSSKLRLRKYINQSGGFSNKAKKGKIYVLYANGTTAATKGGLFGRSYPKLEPGCEIVVPRKPEVDKTAKAAKWLAFTSTLASLVTAIAIALR